MRFSTLVSVLPFALLAASQTVSVDVGLGGLQFSPNNINITEGSVITFKFTGTPGNHTVTQSSFDSPCEPLAGGFDSGFVFIPPNTKSAFPTWNLTVVNASTPIWFFCKQGPHCASGMVGAINAPASGNHTFDAFKSKAMSFSGVPSQGAGALSGVGAVATAVPGPFSGSETGYGQPSSKASGASSSGSAKPSGTGAPNSASSVALSGASMLLSALLGVALI